MSGIDLYLNPTQVDPEPTQPVVGIGQYQSSTQLATPQGDPDRHQNLLETAPPWGEAPAEWLIHSDWGLILELATWGINSTHKRAKNIQDSTTTEGCKYSQETFLKHWAQVAWKIAPLSPVRRLQAWESWQIYLIHRDKHKKANKMDRQRNLPQMKEQGKSPKN